MLGTRFGEVWALRVLAFAALGGALALLLRGARARRAGALRRVALGADGLAAPGLPRAPLALAAVPAAFIAIAPALGGHASVQQPVALLFPLDVAHVLAMSVWIGGLVAAAARAARRHAPAGGARPHAAARGGAVRFSPIALACVVVLLVTGTIQAIEHIARVEPLLHTGFGRAVLIKVGLIAALIALGAVNRRRVVPAARARRGRPRRPAPRATSCAARCARRSRSSSSCSA